MTPEAIVLVITALGAREIVPRVVDAVIKGATGKTSRERSRIDELEHTRRAAEADRDHQALWRRLLQEYASELRSMLIARGVKVAEIPPVPHEPDKKP